MKRLFYLLIPTLILVSCGDKSEKKEEKLAKLKKDRSEIDAKIKEMEAGKKEAGKVVPVTVMNIKPTVFNGNIEVQSVIEGDDAVTAFSQAPGTVKSVLVHAGQRVSAGTVLAILDAGAQEQQIAATSAQLNFAKTLYEKQQSLWNQKIGTEVQLLQAKTNYEAAQKNLAALQAQRNMYKIVAPVSGVVQNVDLKPGSAVNPGTPGSGIQIVNNSKLRATAMLGENYLGKVKVGDPAMIVLPNINDSLRASLSFVAETVEPLSRAFRVQVQLPGNGKLHPNMSCIMKIANYTNPRAFVVPVSVIQKTQDGSSLFIADGNKAKAVSVTTGRISNGNVEILSGLNEGDKVITAGYEEMENGQTISFQ